MGRLKPAFNVACHWAFSTSIKRPEESSDLLSRSPSWLSGGN
jgi:hypothetical protein